MSSAWPAMVQLLISFTLAYSRIAMITRLCFFILITVEPQWLEHLWDHGNSFKTWVVQATEG